jgi:hypothetical protein
MSDIIEIDNIITKSYQEAIHSQIIDKSFPWYFNPTMVADGILTKDVEYNLAGYHHFLYEESKPVSPFFQFLYPLVLQIQDHSDIPMKHSIERMRLNMSLPYKDSEHQHHLPHIDSHYEHWNGIYYVNDSDGDTYIFEETNDDYDMDDLKFIQNHKFTVKHTVTPKQGKLVLFNGKHYHSSSFCQNAKYRAVININFSHIKNYVNIGNNAVL